MTTTENSELDALTAEPKALALASGLEIEIERLKTRQLFKFVKIVTSGAGGLLGSLNLSSEGDSSEFAGQLLALTLVAIPEAEDEAIDFIRSLVRPAGLVVSAKSKKDQARNEELFQELYAELENPELEDLFTIFEQLISVEAEHVQALGKRLLSVLKVRTEGVEAKNS